MSQSAKQDAMARRAAIAKLSHDQVHAVAAHLALAEAIIHTRLPAAMKPERRRFRLSVGGRSVQVISRRTGDWQISDVDRPLASDIRAVVLVDFIVDPAEFYVVPAEWFRHDVDARHQAFLGRVGTRPRNPGSKHHNVQTDHVAQWLGRWNVLMDVRR